MPSELSSTPTHLRIYYGKSFSCYKLLKKFETLLEKKYLAKGRGLHEKISYVQSCLSNDIVKDLRFVATIRNKALHEADYDLETDHNEFVKRCLSLERFFGIVSQKHVTIELPTIAPDQIGLTDTNRIEKT